MCIKVSNIIMNKYDDIDYDSIFDSSSERIINPIIIRPQYNVIQQCDAPKVIFKNTGNVLLHKNNECINKLEQQIKSCLVVRKKISRDFYNTKQLTILNDIDENLDGLNNLVSNYKKEEEKYINNNSYEPSKEKMDMLNKLICRYLEFTEKIFENMLDLMQQNNSINYNRSSTF